MTPGARIQAAIELLEAIDRGDRPADGIIARWGRANRYAGGGDRRAVQGLLYGAIRHRRQLEWQIERVGSEIGPRTIVIASILLLEGWEAERLMNAFATSRYGPAPLTESEQSAVRGLAGAALADPAQPLDVRLNIPAWLQPMLAAAFGDALEGEVEALSGEASVDLRVNTLKATRDEAVALLAADGVAAAPTPYSPHGLRLDRRLQLSACRAWREGVVEVQDEGSQIIALLTGARPGTSVVDLCAGGGGKSLALAAAMQDRGRIVACDVSENRLRRGRPRRQRAGVTIVEERLLRDETDSWVAANAAEFERVLVDVPCSGSGAWRRHPEAKWRLTPDRLVELTALQDRLLDAAAGLITVGGWLVYATCSVLPCENHDRVAAFLGRWPGFRLVPAAEAWPAGLDADIPADRDCLMLTPARHGTDGFFGGVLERMP